MGTLRLFGIVRPLTEPEEGMMSYTRFVWGELVQEQEKEEFVEV